ncbi:MAG: hypothetical protein FJ044_04780, partial [Candidatus Cloacimonetes bacterium]|nr:hypothetical protein [Candidatus Cloacimonadota bacterium]
FVTAKVPLAQSLAVTEKKVDESFTVELFKAIDKDIEFDWWIVESVEIGLSH